ncbi:MAG: GAF domain-containing protein, partial [bacterium]
MLNPEKTLFTFKSIAQPGRKNVLQRLEKMFKLQAKGFSISVDQVDVYQQVYSTGEAIFVQDTGQVLAQMLSFSEDGLVAKVLEAFGRDPAVYLPLFSQDHIVGVLNVAGSDLVIEDMPALKAFASYISAALASAQLIKEVKDQEFAYRSLFNNMPMGIYRVSVNGTFIMANPVFLRQFRVDSFDQIDGKTLQDFGLKPLHDRNEVIRRLTEEHEVIGLESEWETPTGEKVFFKENIKASLGPDGEVLYYEGSVEDITERKLTERILKKQLDDLMVLNRVAATGAGASNLDDFLNSITEVIGEQLFPDHFGVILWDPTKRILKLHPSYRGVPKELMATEFLPGEGIIGKVFSSGEPLLVTDTNLHPDYIYSGQKMGSELCVPIKTGDSILGVLNAEMEATHGFTVEDEILLLTIADQLATALDKVTFFDAVENQALQLALLNEAVLTTSRILDPNELFRLIAAQIKELFKPDSFVVTLFDENSQQLEIAITFSAGEIDPEMTGIRLPLEQGGLTTLVIETGQVLHVDDLENSPLIVGIQKTQNKMVGSWVGVPLISGKKVIGALAVQYFDKMLIDKDQTQFLVSMASHAAIAISNGRMFDDVQRRFDMSKRLAAISESLNRSQSVSDVIETIGKSSCKLMNNSAGIVCLISEHGGLECVWKNGLEEIGGDQLDAAFTRTILNSSMPIVLPDVN